MTYQIVLQPRKCQVCNCKIPRNGWSDKRQMCAKCKAKRNAVNSKKWAVIHKLRWIPEQLKDKIVDIEEPL